jgi:hypothetical protein
MNHYAYEPFNKWTIRATYTALLYDTIVDIVVAYYVCI